MNISKTLMSAVLLSMNIATAYALPADSLYQLTITEAGSLSPIYRAESQVPFKASYDQLSESQKKLVRKKFDKLGVNDTPPYPVKGSANLYRPLFKAGARQDLSGKLLITATIDRHGIVSNVEVKQSPSAYFALSAIKLVSNTPFKAASCDGTTCEMDFPIEIQFN